MNLNIMAPKILIIMFGRIGDILLTTPVPAELKRLLPASKVYFLIKKEFYDVLSLNPDINEILLLEEGLHSQYKLIRQLRNEKFDYVFDFQSNSRSALMTFLSNAGETFGYHFDFRLRDKFYRHAVKIDSKPMYAVEHKFNLLRSAGLTPENHRTYFYFTENDKRFAEEILEKFGLKDKNFAIFSTTSRRPANRWLPEYFGETAKNLYKATGITPLFIYAPPEREYVMSIFKMCSGAGKVLPEMTLKQTGALISMAKFVLGLDNGLKHLAVAVGTPTFTIFGPSQPVHWTPPERKHVWIRADIDCIECFKRKCDDLECMKVLTPEIVFNKILKFLYEEINMDITKS